MNYKRLYYLIRRLRVGVRGVGGIRERCWRSLAHTSLNIRTAESTRSSILTMIPGRDSPHSYQL